jgi:hypothetical protein
MRIAEERLDELSKRFQAMLRKYPLTKAGIPPEEETKLTRDIWAALTDAEKKAVLENTRRMVAEELETQVPDVPDQTPYAMRLTHLYFETRVR